MEYNLHRDFDGSFSTAFKRYATTSELEGAVDRYVTSQGNQVGVQNFAEILINIAYNYAPEIAGSLYPSIVNIIQHNGSQAGMQAVASVMLAIVEEAMEDGTEKERQKALVDAFVEQNDNQLGLPILVSGVPYSFGAFLKDYINTLAS